MVKDYISKSKIYPVLLVTDGVELNKDIVEIKSKLNENEIISYQSLNLFINQDLGNVEDIQNNFDLVWKVYSETNYDGNILKDSLDILKEYWQNENLKNFNQFLKDHPLLYSDGFYYGVEEVDRNEMSQQLGMYNLKKEVGLNPTTIQWHSKKKACKDFTIEEFTNLLSAIEEYTLPYYNMMQERKEQIFSAEDKLSILNISLIYE